MQRALLVHILSGFLYTRLKAWFSHITDILQPVVAAVIRQGEEDASASLLAAADLSESLGHAGHEEHKAAQQNRDWKNEDQQEGGRQEEAILSRIEGTVPAIEKCVEGGHVQGTVT